MNLTDLNVYSLGNDIFEALKNKKYSDLEDMVLRMNLTHSETEKKIDVYWFRFTILWVTCRVFWVFLSVFEIVDVNITLASFTAVAMDDIRLGTIVTIEPNRAVQALMKISFIQFWD